MRYMLRITVGVALLVACLAGRTAAADAARPSSSKVAANAAASSKSPAEKLVREALEAELAGDATERARLLRGASDSDPDHASSRWHSGEMQVDGRWMPIDSLGQHFSTKQILAKYRERRSELIDTADNQRELARWCDNHQLKSEGRVHWIKLLEFEPTDAEAIKALKLRIHEGRLATREQLELERLALARRAEAYREWQPRIAKWRTALLSEDTRQRQSALDELAAFDVPDAIPALEVALGRNDDLPNSVALNEVLIQTLDRITDQAATEALLRRALTPDSEAVRLAAARALGRRPPSTWLPRLIAQLPPREQVTTSHRFFACGGYLWRLHELTVLDKDTGAVNKILFSDVEAPSAAAATPEFRAKSRGSRFLMDSMRTDISLANAIEQQDLKRARVNLVLQVATKITEEDLSLDQWLQKAAELSETYRPPNFATPSAWRQLEYRQIRATASCFPAGTPVLTTFGLVAIDELKPGDQAVAQNIETGQLDIQPIQQVTLRPAAPLVEIEAGGETIRATRGHPFWINGQGWLMAKHLQAGQYLHTPDGPLKIERIGEQPAQEAYNLVVSDFATYFVGNQKILVHDNQTLTGTGMLVPGLAARDVASTQAP